MKVTNEVLNEKIDRLHEKFDLVNSRVDKLEFAEQANTAFRHKANGVVAVVGAIGAFIGSLAMFLVGKVWK